MQRAGNAASPIAARTRSSTSRHVPHDPSRDCPIYHQRSSPDRLRQTIESEPHTGVRGVAHALIGASVGVVLAGGARQEAWPVVAIAAGAALLPDLDIQTSTASGW